MAFMFKESLQLDGAAGTPANRIDLNSATVQGGHAPVVNMSVRMVGIGLDAAPSGAGAVAFKHRPTLGSATGEVTIATVNLLTSHSAGTVVIADGLNREINPGGEIVAEVTSTTGAGNTGVAMVWVDYDYENPDNIAEMVRTT